jgi:hypothetical protein
MRQYLFLYPVKRHFDRCLEDSPGFLRNGYDANHIGRIIDHRYRKKGYGINWLMFDSRPNSSKPNLNALTPYVGARPEDHYLCAGVTWDLYASYKVYADSDFVLAQLPEIEELVIGGFHLQDCVEGLARYAHNKGIEVRVDEDTTNGFFSRTAISGEIPLEMDKLDFYRMLPDWMAKHAVEYSKARPWLAYRIA